MMETAGSINENQLRWKARIGSLKWLAVFIFGGAGCLFLIVMISLITALSNPSDPRPVTIHQLVKGEIDTLQYVSVEGTSFYDWRYDERDGDGGVRASYYFLLDEPRHEMILVRASAPVNRTARPTAITVVGMTALPSPDLEARIRQDLEDMDAEGFTTAPELILNEGQVPGNALFSIVCMLPLGLAMLVGLVPFFLPGTIFVSYPLPAEGGAWPIEAEVRASGRFLRLKKIEPRVELGGGARKFNQAGVRLVPLDAHRLMAYILDIRTVRYRNIPLGKIKSHWAIFLEPARVTGVEFGKLYGWKERWAVRIYYRDERNRPDMLLVSFNHSAVYVDFVNQLRQMGYPTSAPGGMAG